MGNRAGGSMVAKTDALPGRAKPIEDFASLEHFVLGTPILLSEGDDKAGYVLPDGTRALVAHFATGCFWGSEKSFWRMPGVVSTAVGYVAGFTPNPTYEEVCSGMTGHTEGVRVYYDPRKLAFADLMRNFLQSHDPTQGMGQGNDRGTQYRSGVYPTREEDAVVARAAIEAYERALGRKVTAEVVFPAPTFYYAEKYHQQYLAKPGARPYCSAEPTGVQLPPPAEWLPEGAEKPKLGEAYWEKWGPTPGCVIRQPHAQIKWDL